MLRNQAGFIGLLSLIVFIGVLAAQSRPAQAQAGYATYHNARFNYSIAYPAKVLIPQGEAANGDGQKFLSRDGRVEMLVYGSNNSLNQTLRDAYQEEINPSAHPQRRISYQVMRADWFVVSGTENGRVFYQKTFLRREVFKTFRIEYDESQKGTFDSITAAIAKSFKG